MDVLRQRLLWGRLSFQIDLPVVHEPHDDRVAQAFPLVDGVSRKAAKIEMQGFGVIYRVVF